MASKKYEVHWVKAWGMCMAIYEDKHHGTFDTLEEAQQSVRDWWKKNNFEPRYVRQIARITGDGVWWDYGCHTSFYVFKEVEK